MRTVTAVSTAFLMFICSMAGCIEALEDLGEIIGCSDESASNFDPDATSGSDDLCLFLENEARFMAVMGDAMAADPSSYLLDSDSGVSGVEYSMSMSGNDPDSGMSVSMEMLSVIMVDLESQSLYNRTMISYMDMISIDTEMVWSDTDIMVTTSIGGPMASETGESGTTSSISRDMSPDLEEIVRIASYGMTGMMGMEDLLMPDGLPDGDDHDDRERGDDEDCTSDEEDCGDGEDREEDGDEGDFEWFDRDQDGFVEMGEIESLLYEDPSISSEMADCIIDNVGPVFSDTDENDDQKLDEDEFSDFDNYLEDNFDIDRMCGDGNHLTEDMMPEGSSVSITHDEETGIQTMVMQTVDDTGDMAMTIRLHEDGSFHSYEMDMYNDEGIMTMSFSYLTSEMVSIPEIDFTLDRTATPIFVEVETMMVCDNGDLVDVSSVMDGWWDCNDGSDESFVDDRDEHYYEAHWDFCEWDEYLVEDGYMEEGYLCWVEDLNDLSVTQIEELQDCEQSENGCETEVYCEELDYGSWECAYYDIDINEDEGDGLDWSMYHWKSYFDGHCEWEGNPDDENRWSCMEDINHSDWDNWWYYCENHDEDWFCTDDYGQDPDHEHSADNVNYNESNASEEDPSWVDGTSWELYPGGHCEWEGNPDDEEDSWSCKGAEWDNWWFYCENHEEHWFCTDGPGQDPDHEHSADNDNYPEADQDDEEICIWEDEDGIVHYDCEEESEDYDIPVVMHAHVVGQVLNVPIADFELRVLDCAEDDMDAEDDMEDDSDPVWDDCTVVMAFPLSGGEIDGVVVDYVDSDGDGMISSGDISIVSGPVGDYEIQPYDMWAGEYSADSALIGQELPGLGAFVAVIGLLGAALAGRERDA